MTDTAERIEYLRALNAELQSQVLPPPRGRRGGWQHPKRKLADESVRYIRSSVETPTELARMFGVHRKVIYQIREGVTYQWLQ